jgi:hypothetical protein
VVVATRFVRPYNVLVQHRERGTDLPMATGGLARAAAARPASTRRRGVVAADTESRVVARRREGPLSPAAVAGLVGLALRPKLGR